MPRFENGSQKLFGNNRDSLLAAWNEVCNADVFGGSVEGFIPSEEQIAFALGPSTSHPTFYLTQSSADALAEFLWNHLYAGLAESIEDLPVDRSALDAAIAQMDSEIVRLMPWPYHGGKK